MQERDRMLKLILKTLRLALQGCYLYNFIIKDLPDEIDVFSPVDTEDINASISLAENLIASDNHPEG